MIPGCISTTSAACKSWAQWGSLSIREPGNGSLRCSLIPLDLPCKDRGGGRLRPAGSYHVVSGFKVVAKLISRQPASMMSPVIL